PQGMIRRQWLGFGYIDDGAGELTGVQSGQKCEVIELRTASRMDQRSAFRQLRKQVAIQDPARVLGERQQADQNVGLAEHLAETVWPAICRTPLDRLARSAPATQGKAERLQAFQHGAAE